jgi:hypothetical protein
LTHVREHHHERIFMEPPRVQNRPLWLLGRTCPIRRAYLNFARSAAYGSDCSVC